MLDSCCRHEKSLQTRLDGRVGLRGQIKVLVRKGVGSNPTLIIFQSIKRYKGIYCCDINYMNKLVYDATLRLAREIAWIEITVSLCVSQSSLVDESMFVM